MRKFLYNIVIENTTQAGRLFDLFIQSLIIISIIAFSIETIPNLKKSNACVRANYIIWQYKAL